jgi:hypothetical protein
MASPHSAPLAQHFNAPLQGSPKFAFVAPTEQLFAPTHALETTDPEVAALQELAE